MRSLVIELNGTEESVQNALKESEYYAALCGYGGKQMLQIRLLSEETISMATEVLMLEEGSFWVEKSGNRNDICLSAKTQVVDQARQKLMSVSSTGEDILYRGFKGKIHQAIDRMLVRCSDGKDPSGSQNASAWSLIKYRQKIEREQKAQEWDELEKSVLGKLADDVQVGVLSDRVEIIVSKSFS